MPNTELGDLQIKPAVQNVPLNELQTSSIIDYGYFIDLGNKLFTVLNEDIITLKSVYYEDSLSGKLKKIAELH